MCKTIYLCISPFLYLLFLSGSVSLTAHTEAPTEGKPVVRQPGVDSRHENPSRPPSVKVIRGSASGSWARLWSTALLFSALSFQWTLF